MKAYRQQWVKKSLPMQTVDEIAEAHGVDEGSVRRWVADGCPHQRGKRNRLEFDPAAVAEWKLANNRGKVGRPKTSAAPDGLEHDKDYWLARKYRNQCLRDEGVLVDRNEFIGEMSRLVQTAKSKLIGGPAQLAPQCYGQDVPTIEKILDEWIEHAINGIALAD